MFGLPGLGRALKVATHGAGHENLHKVAAHNRHQARSIATNQYKAMRRRTNDQLSSRIARATLPKNVRKYVR